MTKIRRCSIKNCYTMEGKFFKFPKPGTMKYDRWLEKCSSSYRTISTLKKPLICAKHFEKNCFGKTRLLFDAEPSLFLSEIGVKVENESNIQCMQSDFLNEDVEERIQFENKELHMNIKKLKAQNMSYQRKVERLYKRNKQLNKKRLKLVFKSEKHSKEQEAAEQHSMSYQNELEKLSEVSEEEVNQDIKLKQEKFNILQSQLSNQYDDDYHFLMSFRHPLKIMRPQTKSMFCTKLKALLNSFTLGINSMSNENGNNSINL
ncbi:uncharacterized protein LOC119670196 [Teleopsis dalmanni]|uniref:uncharacterized protein LOC119670196 n=1 Tax=Teleopsis dalmanni TaxID=139649 RepID=UPI0018CDB4AA|nr:uncharacterized protein LOC119670196 [Teleopsis dalmanni]